jgi:putative ABC transport system permease protein
MYWKRWFASVMRNVFRRKRIEQDLHEEVSAYVELLTDEKVTAGMNPPAARRAALHELGGVDQVTERVRDVRAGAVLERMVQDARYAVRALRHNPGFALAAILALALGIGVTTSIFSLVYGVLLRPLPYPAPEELQRVWMNNPRQGIEKDVISYPIFLAWRERSKSFEQMVVVRNVTSNLTGDGDPEELRGESVSEGFFQMYGVRPVLGSWFSAEQESPDGPRALMLSHELWVQRFGSDRNIVGRTVQLNGEAYPVVGVMPAGFGEAKFWMPLQFRGGLAQMRTSAGTLWLPIMGRLRAGVSMEQAQAEMTRVASEVGKVIPAAENYGVLLESLQESIIGDSRTSLLLLLAAVVVVLLIACANIANLLLARGTTRRGELAVRVALGAGRGALVRQVLVESVVLGLIGGAVGTALAWVGVDFLVRVGSESLPRLESVQVDRVVLAFSFLASMVASVLFGVVPALDVARQQPSEMLRAGGRGSVGGSGVRPVLVAGQFALALIMLYSAGLLLRSFSNLLHVERGFDTENVLAVDLSLRGQRYQTSAAVGQFYEQFLPSVRALPGVESADVISTLLLSRLANSASVVVRGMTDVSEAEAELPVAYDVITPGLLRTMRMTIVRGRGLTESDGQNRPTVAIVNEAFVRRYLKNTDPIGRQFAFGQPDNDSGWVEIVGVVRDAKRAGLGEPVAPYAFFALRGGAPARTQLMVRTTGDPLNIVPQLRAAVRQVDAGLPLTNVRLLDQDLARTLAPRRFVMLLLSTFAAAALILAAIGIFGVISYMVGRRTREFGLRMALGARPREVLGLVLRQAGRQVGAGVLLGTAGAFASARLLRTQLYGVDRLDSSTALAAVIVLTAVALLAVIIPARRATGADPLIALRSD